LSRQLEDSSHLASKPLASTIDPDAAKENLEPADAKQRFMHALKAATASASRLPHLARSFSTAWPPAVREMLPTPEPGMPVEQIWPPVLAWVVLQSLPVQAMRVRIFDELQLRSALAEIFASMGVETDNTWRAAARLRVLLLLEDSPSLSLQSPAFWTAPDLRWLAGIHEASGKTYMNKEQFEDLICWLQLPALLKVASSEKEAALAIRKIEEEVSQACLHAKAAGYDLDRYLQGVDATPAMHVPSNEKH